MYKEFYIYILARQRNGTLYVGCTSNIIKRVWEHKNNYVKSFSKKYRVHTLVYYEIYNDFHSAASREKQLKNWKRHWKIELIEHVNPTWRDLYDDIIG